MKITIFSKKEYKELKKIKESFEIDKDGEICLAIGGDGTFIHAAQNFSGPILPIRDNEAGSTGYYADIGIDKINQIIELLKAKKYKIESLGKKIEITYKNKKYFAINECYLTNDIGEVAFKIYEIKNNKKILIYPFVIGGDGVIITGRIGSTAYNRAASGPIILENNILCVTFINPDGPYKNSLVLDSNKTLEIEITKYDGFLHYDNFEIGKLKKGDTFRVNCSNKKINIVKLNGITEGFGSKLQRVVTSKMQKA